MWINSREDARIWWSLSAKMKLFWQTVRVMLLQLNNLVTVNEQVISISKPSFKQIYLSWCELGRGLRHEAVIGFLAGFQKFGVCPLNPSASLYHLKPCLEKGTKERTFLDFCHKYVANTSDQYSVFSGPKKLMSEAVQRVLYVEEGTLLLYLYSQSNEQHMIRQK